MMKACYKVGACLVLMFTSTFSFADCDELRKYEASLENISSICKSTIGVLFGYNTAIKAPSWALYDMGIKVATRKPFYLKYSGAIAPIKEVSLTSQLSLEQLIASGQSKAFLVPHYNVVSVGSQLHEFLTMANVFPVNLNAWKNSISQLMFELGANEREMAKNKGEFTVIAGVSYDAKHINNVPSAKYIYKVYFHEQYNYTLSYLIPVAARSENLNDYITSIKCIEQVTGHSLLSGLGEDTKNSVINGVAYSSEHWVAPNQVERECLIVE